METNAMSGPKWKNTAYAHPDDITPERWDRLMMTVSEYSSMVEERAARDMKAPATGQVAPDFIAHRLSPAGELTGETFHLHKALGKPLGLIFGSYT